MKEKPFHPQSKYTTMDNLIIDHVMPGLSGSAWKVLTVIIRKTRGWHKEQDEVSFRQLLALTGIKSFTTLTKALDELEKKKIIIVDRGDGPGHTFIYSLNTDFEIEVKERVTKTVTGESVTESVTPTVTKTVTPPPQKVLQNLEQQKKESLKKDSKRKRGATPPPIHISVRTYQHITNRYPDKATWETIAQTVGESPEALALWEKVIRAWIGCGYNKLNLTGMLDCFKRGELPTTKKGPNNGTRYNTQATERNRRAGEAPPPVAATGLGEWTEDEKRLYGFS